MPRLFFALELGEAHRAAITRLKREEWPARWVAPTRLHLTLRFLGDVHGDAVGHLVRSTLGMPRDPVCGQPEGAGLFPGRGRPRVLWLGLVPDDAMCRLQAAAEAAARAAGLPSAVLPWHPHVTLARFRSKPGPWLDDTLEAVRSLGLQPLKPTSVVLFASRPGPEPYRALARRGFRSDTAAHLS